jgi:hypothetical protein
MMRACWPTACQGLMGCKSLTVSSTLEMLDMHADLKFYPLQENRVPPQRVLCEAPPLNARELFNIRHSSLRVTI